MQWSKPSDQAQELIVLSSRNGQKTPYYWSRFWIWSPRDRDSEKNLRVFTFPLQSTTYTEWNFNCSRQLSAREATSYGPCVRMLWNKVDWLLLCSDFVYQHHSGKARLWESTPKAISKDEVFVLERLSLASLLLQEIQTAENRVALKCR